jgi:hypothetical protein
MATIQGVAPLQGDGDERREEGEREPPTTPTPNPFSFTPTLLQGFGRARKSLRGKQIYFPLYLLL